MIRRRTPQDARPHRSRNRALAALAGALVVTLLVVDPTPSAPDLGKPAVQPAAGGSVRSYVAVGDSLTSGLGPADSLEVPGPNAWVHGETVDRLQRVGGWAYPGRVTEDMRAAVVPTDADVLVLLAGTNDLIRGVPWERTAENLRAISATVGARQTLLVAVVPIDSMAEQRRTFNQRLVALAADAGWRYVDPWTSLAAGDRWLPGASPDALHPTPESAVVAGRSITDAAWQAAGRRARR